MGLHRVVLVAGITSLLLPAVALAGAPNYDCTLQGGRGRLAIDQWRPKVVAIGVGHRATNGGLVENVAQDGPSLDFTTTLSGIRWDVAIRDSGKRLTMRSADATLTGRRPTYPRLRSVDRQPHTESMRRTDGAIAHEEGLALFISPEWRARYRESLDNARLRRKMLAKLYHFRHLDLRYAHAVARSDQNPAFLGSELARRRAPSICYLVSADDTLDGREMELAAALEIVAEGFYWRSDLSLTE